VRKANGVPVRFGPYAFDPDRLELTREGRPVHLQPQPSQVLALLLAEPGRLVTREEIQQAVWADRFVEFDAGLNFSIRQIRRVLDDSAESPAFIATVPRRGYRFVAPVTRVDRKRVARDGAGRRRRVLGAVAGVVALAAIAVAWPGITHLTAAGADRPLRIAVVPFASLTDGEEYYAAGLTEDVVTELALLSPARLGVIAPTSMLELERRAGLAAGVPAVLDADFVVRGTVRMDGLYSPRFHWTVIWD
jgi:DNA-binding winged helix-turn-helix (wHTH) protein